MDKTNREIYLVLVVVISFLSLFLFIEDQVFAASKPIKKCEQFIVDRVEERIAILEKTDGSVISIGIPKLPRRVKEGDILNYSNGVYKIDKKGTKLRQKEMQKFLEMLCSA